MFVLASTAIVYCFPRIFIRINMPEEDKSEISSPIFEYEWMIRPCEMYREEYSDCTSLKARFHQYFIYGETVDCSQWKRDYNNCEKWKDNKDIKAAKEIIESETTRRKERLGAHYANNIWKRRTSPPEDWAKPLPDFIAKDYDRTYLGIKAKEMKGESVSEDMLTERTLLKAHYANNIWEKRTPAGWVKPLPNFIAKDYDRTYLGIEAKEMKDESVPENIFGEKIFFVQ